MRQGRMSRLGYLAVSVLIGAIAYASLALLGLFGLAMIVIPLVIVKATFASYRLRDIGADTRFAAFILVPFINIIADLALVLTPRDAMRREGEEARPGAPLE